MTNKILVVGKYVIFWHLLKLYWIFLIFLLLTRTWSEYWQNPDLQNHMMKLNGRITRESSSQFFMWRQFKWTYRLSYCVGHLFYNFASKKPHIPVFYGWGHFFNCPSYYFKKLWICAFIFWKQSSLQINWMKCIDSFISIIMRETKNNIWLNDENIIWSD